MNKYQKLNNLFGWITFVISSAVFLLTIEPTASWWDCGEYIATAFKLQVGHPPGAPLFQMLGRFFSLFAFGDVGHVAMMVNIMSALSSSFTVLFLFWSITLLAQKLFSRSGEMTPGQMYTIFAAGFIGALAYTFTDSFWFSAVEGEVYAMSSFFTAITFWAVLKWESVADEEHSYRWLILIGLLIGLAIGVHLLNLLVIPATCFVIYFKKFKPTLWGSVLTFLVGILILAFLMFILIPGLVQCFAKTDLFFVNVLNLPFNSGTIFYGLLMIFTIILGLYSTSSQTSNQVLNITLLVLFLMVFLYLVFLVLHFLIAAVLSGLIITAIVLLYQKKPAILNTIILALAFVLIGYSSFVMLVIRANSETPINENAPKDAISLLSYLNREQYGDFPLLYGQYYNAPVVDYKDGNPVYAKEQSSGKYVVIDDRKGTVPEFDPNFCTIFPRMWSNERKGSEEYYRNWGGPGVPVTITDPDGKPETKNKPRFSENLKYFFSYQVGWMYLRYFMWNFSGRQNDVQGYGGIQDGNWISGIPFVDKLRLGHSMNDIPDNFKNRGTNKYYMLPLLLGLIGFFFQLKQDNKGSVVVILLFIMTGIAISVYLNQKPFEPRERDYAYAGSFYAFAIWIGLGVIYVIRLLNQILKKEMLSIGLGTLLLLILVPGIMAKENWDDHDRSGKYACRDFAAGYLNSCDKNGVLFTNGDNDTFPLWYNQEVEGVRTDVRVINLMLASGSWYIDQLFKKTYDSEPLPFTLDRNQYGQGKNDIIIYYDIGVKGYVELKELLGFIRSENPETYLTLQNGDRIKFFPSKKVKLTVDSAACVKYGIVPGHLRGKMVDTIYWTIKSNQLYKNDIMLLDILGSSDWTRPLYFAAPSSVKHCLDIDSFCHVEGWVYKFMPVKAEPNDYIAGMGGVDAIGTYDILMNKCSWGNLNDPHVYVDPESLNNAVRPKTTYLRAAQSLIEMKKEKQAVALMDDYFKHFPDSKIPYDIYNLPYADLYYKAGFTEKANKIVERIAYYYAQDLDYYASFSIRDKDYFQEDIQAMLSYLRRLNMNATQNNQPALAKKMDSLFNEKAKVHGFE